MTVGSGAIPKSGSGQTRAVTLQPSRTLLPSLRTAVSSLQRICWIATGALLASFTPTRGAFKRLLLTCSYIPSRISNIQAKCLSELVELRGIEPLTSAGRCWRHRTLQHPARHDATLIQQVREDSNQPSRSTWRIFIPALKHAPTRHVDSRSGRIMPMLSGLRVLIVEDESVLADDLSEIITAAEGLVVGPVATGGRHGRSSKIAWSLMSPSWT